MIRRSASLPPKIADGGVLSAALDTVPGMLHPSALRPGDVVAVVSPSSAVTEDLQPQLRHGVETLTQLGLSVRFAPHALGRWQHSAGTARQRAEDLNSAWADPQVSMILMSQGGQTANGLLDRLDYPLFAAQPKIFMGMSDGTTLISAIAARAGVVAFHGPDLLWGFGRPMSRRIRDQFRAVLVDGAAGPVPAADLRTIRPGRASGRLFGGHSNILKDTLFAGYGPDLDGAILFLEGTHPIAELCRHFQAYRLRGVFDQISGLVLGHFDGLDTPRPSVAEVVLEATDGHSFPIVELDELGHNVENFVFPIGVRATIDTRAGRLILDEPAVTPC